MYQMSDKMKSMMKMQNLGFVSLMILMGGGAVVVSVIAYMNELRTATPEEPADIGWILFGLLGLFIAVAIVWAQNRNVKGAKALSAQTLERYENALPIIDEELNDPSTIYLKDMKVYMTEHFLLSYGNGFDIIPWEMIVGVEKKWSTDTYMYLSIFDEVGEEHKLESITDSKSHKDLMVQVVEMIQKKNGQYAG